ncbi:hypothetical protein [Streptomyces winkii]|uniref:hypothetical protein n=1 Tax=Streptomyces winkii TaxID=3051178 RepID=UPI0028D171E1|nr:hypothetical protein [Streptomyces sp. DSM 40971]
MGLSVGSSDSDLDDASGTRDTDSPDYLQGMNPDDVATDMRAEAEAEYGDYRQVEDTPNHVWFDKRTGKPFRWDKKAYLKATKEAERAARHADNVASPTSTGSASPLRLADHRRPRE